MANNLDQPLRGILLPQSAQRTQKKLSPLLAPARVKRSAICFSAGDPRRLKILHVFNSRCALGSLPKIIEQFK